MPSCAPVVACCDEDGWLFGCSHRRSLLRSSTQFALSEVLPVTVVRSPFCYAKRNEKAKGREVMKLAPHELGEDTLIGRDRLVIFSGSNPSLKKQSLLLKCCFSEERAGLGQIQGCFDRSRESVSGRLVSRALNWKKVKPF